MKYFNLIAFVLVSLFVYACMSGGTEADRPQATAWQLIYQNDQAGNALTGDKQKLIEAVRLGYPIRIGFGVRRTSDTTKSVEHFADAHFLTIANGQEVFAQILPIVGQYPHLDSSSLQITFRENLQWTIIVGTNGFSDRLMLDALQDTIVGHRDRPTEVSWFACYRQ